MKAVLRILALCFAAGAVGGAAKLLAAVIGARYGVGGQFGVHLPGALAAAALYPRVVLGGLWAFLFVLAPLRSRLLVGALLAALLATLGQWLLPPLLAQQAPGFALLPLLAALLLNVVWAFVTALCLRLFG